MNARKVAKVTILLLAVFVMIFLCTDEALAQSTKAAPKAEKQTSTADHGLASKKGVKGALESDKKKTDKTKTATTLQKTIGVASIFVMIAVVKWL